MNINDGGPAFPQTKRSKEKYMDECGYGRERIVSLNQGGISVRDYFAAAALQGLVNDGFWKGNLKTDKPADAESLAHWSYLIADAMLKERERGE